MTERKITDEDIIKALERCGEIDYAPCDRCIFYKKRDCIVELSENALDLIKRQRAEIERLQEYYKRYYDLTRETKELQDEVEHARDRLLLFDDAITNAKAEAIKEFAERLKENRTRIFNTIYSEYHFGEIIDTLVKEMTESAI